PTGLSCPSLLCAVTVSVPLLRGANGFLDLASATLRQEGAHARRGPAAVSRHGREQDRGGRGCLRRPAQSRAPPTCAPRSAALAQEEAGTLGLPAPRQAQEGDGSRAGEPALF